MQFFLNPYQSFLRHSNHFSISSIPRLSKNTKTCQDMNNPTATATTTTQTTTTPESSSLQQQSVQHGGSFSVLSPSLASSNTSEKILFAAFNQDCSCVSIGTDCSFKVFTLDPLKKCYSQRRFSNEIREGLIISQICKSFHRLLCC